MKKISILFVKLYQVLLSPILAGLGARCRFHPSCSEYAILVLEQNKFPESFFLITKRILKCGPWHEGGVDYPNKVEVTK